MFWRAAICAVMVTVACTDGVVSVPCTSSTPFVLPSLVEVGVGEEVVVPRLANAVEEGCPQDPDGEALSWSLHREGVATIVASGDSGATVRGDSVGQVFLTATVVEHPQTSSSASVVVR